MDKMIIATTPKTIMPAQPDSISLADIPGFFWPQWGQVLAFSATSFLHDLQAFILAMISPVKYGCVLTLCARLARAVKFVRGKYPLNVLTFIFFGRKYGSAQGKISVSGLKPHLYQGVQPPKNHRAVFSMGWTLGGAKARRFLDTVVSIPFVRLTMQIETCRAGVNINSRRLDMVDASTFTKRAPQNTTDTRYRILYETALSDLFDQIKIVHILMLHFENGFNPYEGDDETALRSAVLILRETANTFEQEYFHKNQPSSQGDAA
jgi:hypothetical protein